MFALKASLLRHKTLYECNRGRQPYERQSPYEDERSQNEKKSKKEHMCFRCKRVYAFFTSLWRHQKYECGVEPKFACSICKSRFAQKSNLERLAHDVKDGYVPQGVTDIPISPLMCPQCGRTYKMKRNLRTHMKFECGGQRNFKCHICPAKYTQNISLRRHLLQRHNIYLPPKFSVPKRNLLSFTPRELRHESHRSDRIFDCHQCGRSYQMRHNLVKHLRFECVVFPDSFEVLPQPHDLSVLYMSGVPHEQQRKFRCRFCGKGYRWKSTMRRHETVECGGKPPAFECSKCPYKARQRGNLTVHFKRHHLKLNFDEGA
ncbi:Zinc finger and SCAN domain-containing protein [Ooceraea biroi]|uniref:Zinc finger and SCAN domain-containing protein n=1 Tax=Ooceraea biroi TaxID=2015173 RepID=A0A026W5G3_OOCBI|nr:Zinc finger and SCAN domain-containing protein [Ooceraea biroi]